MSFFWSRRTGALPNDGSQLPTGNLGRSFVGNTFAFHSNAQAVVLDARKNDPDARIIRAKVLGRDVGLVVDHELAVAVLKAGSQAGEDTPRFSHREAYKQLVGDFFTEPNILLEDEDETKRGKHREDWDNHIEEYVQRVDVLELAEDIIQRHRASWEGDQDVYAMSKKIAEELVFRIFLGLDIDDDLYTEAAEATHTSLQGQFSLPVKFGGFVQTPYTRGLAAQADYNVLVGERVRNGSCPFMASANIPYDSMVSHVSMFASSLVIKALASSICFTLIQRTRYSGPTSFLVLETQRLCPPIIGVLRKVLDRPWQATEGMHVPENWDTWLYFPLINRDKRVYGDDADTFRPDRWKDTLAEPLTLGQGGKRCLGRELVSRLVGQVVEAFGEMTITSGMNAGVRDFLGWESDGVHRWEGIKQLPVQRPKEPIMLRRR